MSVKKPLLPRPAARFRVKALCLFLVALTAAPASAWVVDDKNKPKKLFKSEDTLVVSMTAPWREFVRNEDYKGAYPAALEYTDELGNNVILDLTVERRGVTRQRVCKIPPVKLRFEKGSAKGTTFRGQGSLKMVTHCEMSSGYEQYYILEMLAYRMYNLLTDYSFKVRPLTVTYHQVEDPDEKESRFSFLKKKTSEGPVFAFLIEDDKDVANRFDLNKLNVGRVSVNQLDSDESALLALFQYMISNVDWAATRGPDPDECCHNVKLIGPEPTRPEDTVYAIPYDFDSAGLVNSPYAHPPEGLGVNSVTQRLYRGYCAHNASLEGARQEMLDNESAIYGLVEAEGRLEAKKQQKAREYLEEFFAVMRDDKAFQKKIVERCRG